MTKPWPQGPNKRRRAEGLRRKLHNLTTQVIAFLDEEGHPVDTLPLRELEHWQHEVGRYLVDQTCLKYRGPTGSPHWVEGE